MKTEKIDLLDQVLDNGFTDKIAVIDKEKEITFDQLRLYTYFLADVLLKTGKLGTNAPVLIFFDKNVEAIIAIFGALKAGAAYVPLDTALPGEKLSGIVEDCLPGMIITQKKTSQKLPGAIMGKYLDRIWFLDVNETGELRVENAMTARAYTVKSNDRQPDLAESFKNPVRHPGDIAYIIFTSGSSGKPKGVMIRHKSVVAFTREVERVGLYDAGTRFLNISPLYFDASVLDIFPVLAVGGTLVLMKKFVMPNEIVLHMDRYKITDTLMVSSLLRLFSSRYSHLHHYELPHLKTLWYGAEACPVDVLRRIKQRLPQVKFIHGYGPTETTHTATWLFFDDVDAKYRDYMPIGKPLSTVFTYALDEKGRYIEKNQTGELYIGGIQLMAGYINDPVRTNRMLVPGVSKKSTLVYKTGDLVSLDEDNNFVYKGRHDDLVKVGGNLVSLCEIQNSILMHPDAADAIVIPITDALFNNKLIAFVVKKNEQLKETDLNEFLETKLSKYMIPETFIFIDEKSLPQTPNGKVDKAELIKMAEKYNQKKENNQ